MKHKDRLQKDSKLKRLYTITKILMAFFVIIAIFFVNYVLSNEFISAQKFLEQGVMQTASNLRGRILNTLNEMKLISVKLTDSASNFSEADIISFLEKHINDYDYHRLIFSYPDGRTIRYERGKGIIKSIDWSQDKRFLEGISGNAIFSATLKDDYTPSGHVNEFVVPVYTKDKKIAGVIGSDVFAQTYLKILGFNNYNNSARSFIIDNSGNYLVTPYDDKIYLENFFSYPNKYIATSEDKVKKALKTNNCGSFIFKRNGKKYVAAFAVIDTPNRLVLTIVPLHVLLLHVDKLLGGITVIVFLISILLLVMSYYSNSLFKQNERIMYDMAFTDEITDGSNKNKFIMDANEILNSDQEGKYALISIDITQFKSINELYGSEHTNKILKDVYDIITKNLSNGSVCVRDYAATFVVLFKYETQEFITKYFINKILDDIQYYNENKMEQVSESSDILRKAKLALKFGIYLISDKSIPVDIMCERANIAKQMIRGNALLQYKYYDDSLRAQILQNKAIEDEMQSALESNQFHMYLQPKFDIETKQLTGAEALVRWIHPEKGLISPAQFIPLFEENGFIVELDKCIWSQACSLLSERKRQGKTMFPISVNVSRLHLNNDAFISELLLLTQKYNVPTKYIELELTESACINDEKRFMEVITNLKSLGFILSMDDFGTGYSSLNILRHLPFDVIKLDRGFIVDSVNDERGRIILQFIVDMANKLNMITLAEGIETEEQLIFLRNLGCKLAQGFYFGRPMDINAFADNFLQDDIKIDSH